MTTTDRACMCVRVQSIRKQSQFCFHAKHKYRRKLWYMIFLLLLKHL